MKILIAEDDAVSRRLLQAYLEKWGHEVAVTENGAQAWQSFQQDKFSVVISDWMMPELDGVELIRRIRSSARPHYVYTILLTARSQKDDVVEGMEAGADDFVTKPFDRDELRVRLRAGERILELEHGLADQNRRLRETQAALVQSEKLASLGRLAAGMAHEINNPIAFVTNNLAVLRRDMETALDLLDRYRAARDSLARVEPDLAAETSRIEQEVDLPYIRLNFVRQIEQSLIGLRRVADILKNLLDFARTDEAEFKDADLNAAVQSAIEILNHELTTKQVRAETHFEQIPPILCHARKINQVLLNLFSNAVKACQPGGLIQARTRCNADRGVTVEIEDNGCGITPDTLPHIFDPFFTTRPVGQGIGLGLSVSYGIVRDHGGTIEVESEPGRGSIFRISLPVQPTRTG